MKHVQKLVLVPIEKWEDIQKKIEDININPVKEDLITSQKPQVNQEPLKVNTVMSPIQVKSQKGLGKKKQKNQIFLHLSPKKRYRGSSLLQHLEKIDTFKWNKNREIIYKERTITNSNIMKLITHAIQHSSKKEPIGMKIITRY